VFTLEIPLALYKQALPPLAAPRALNGKEHGEGRNVLLVEDNPVNQTVIEAMLRSLGFTVSVATDGAQAVRNAESSDFEVILMDCRLPVIDGYEATRQIRQLPGTPRRADHRPHRQRLAGRPRNLSGGGHERLSGKAVQT
jgi:hypothetical protein